MEGYKPKPPTGLCSLLHNLSCCAIAWGQIWSRTDISSNLESPAPCHSVCECAHVCASQRTTRHREMWSARQIRLTKGINDQLSSSPQWPLYFSISASMVSEVFCGFVFVSIVVAEIWALLPSVSGIFLLTVVTARQLAVSPLSPELTQPCLEKQTLYPPLCNSLSFLFLCTEVLSSSPLEHPPLDCKVGHNPPDNRIEKS